MQYECKITVLETKVFADYQEKNRILKTAQMMLIQDNKIQDNADLL